MAGSEKKGCLYSIWIGWIRICRKINNVMENMFEAHTRVITSHYKLVILLCMLFVAVMAVGAIRFKALQRNEELFIPQGSEAFQDLDKGKQYFRTLKFRVEEFIIASKDSSNIFDNNKAFLKTLELHEEIIKIPDFKKSCVTNDNGDCIFISTIEVFSYNKTIITNANTPTKIKSKLNSWLVNPNLLFSNERPAMLNYPNILGNYKGNSTTVISADAVRMTYYMKYVSTSDSNYNAVIDWEDKYISLCGKRVDAYEKDSVNLFYFAARTRDDAILASTVGDLPLFSVAFILMVAFCLVVFLRIKNPVSGHLTIGIAGIFVIMLGVGCGFGLAMWTGNDFVAFTGILMFLILGIGMDNMFIIVDAMETVDTDVQGPERLVIAMKHIGGSITMTTSTDLVAFAVSTVTDFPAVRLFCVYAALSIFFAYVMLTTLFLALLTADINRIEAGKRDVCPCCRAKEIDGNPWLNTEIALSKMILHKWAKFLMKTPTKVIVFLVTCGLLAAGIYGATKITQKFEWKKLSRDGSYFRKFAETRDQKFPAGYDVSVIIPPVTDYTSKSIQDQIIQLDMIAGNNTRFEKMTLNWLKQYKAWAGKNGITDITGNNFNKNITHFLSANKMFKTDVNLDKNNVVTSSRVMFFYENSNDALNQANAMKTIRKDLKEKSSLTGIFPISIMFIYAEQFAAVFDDTVQNLAICAGTILLITLPYLMHPGITALVFLSFVSLLFELLGLMAAWDVSLDVIAMIIIIMAIGFSVDYTCHIAHAFMISRKGSPEERVVDALETMGTSVLNGGFSTLLGMLITAFSGAEGFRIFFKMVFGIVVLGLFHGLIFLPVLLSVFVRRDLREDMREFVEKHDYEDQEKSQRRLTKLTEEQKRRQSLSYRKQSSAAHPYDNGYYHSTISENNSTFHNDQNIQLKNIKKLETDDVHGLQNQGYD